MSRASNSIEDLLSIGLDVHRRGDVIRAESLYREALVIDERHAEAWHLLGLALHQKGVIGDAIAAIEMAVSLAPAIPDFRFNLAIVLSVADRHEDAAEIYRHLLDDGHRSEAVLNGYALALKASGNLPEAEQVFLQLIDEHPEFVGGIYNLGNLLMSQGRAGEALKHLKEAQRLEPQNMDIARNLATVYQMLGDTTRGIQVLNDALMHHLDDAGALNNLGNMYRQAGNLKAAYETLTKAIAADPELPDAPYNLGTLLADINKTDEAITQFNVALTHRPKFVKARWASKLCLPQIYSSVDHRDDCRQRWLAGLDQIAAEVDQYQADDAFIEGAYEAVSEITPFALPYLGVNARDPMSKWGKLVSTITGRVHGDAAARNAVATYKRKRVVFVSAHLREHTIARLFSDWVVNMDRAAFDVRILSTSGPGDHLTAYISRHVDRAYINPMSITECVRALAEIKPDIIIYPDIGMDPKTQVIASLRLAPSQLMAWGHPITSGFASIDGFLSSQEMEPDDGQQHYAERLYQLPGLSVCYEQPLTSSAALPHDFLCAQSLFKIPPTQDTVLARILAECPGSVLSFIAHPIPEVTAAFRARLSDACKSLGLDPGECLDIIAPCDRETFIRHLAGARVILDTFDWSGGNTSLESFAMGRPVVTLPGEYMRGRHTFAMLNMMEIPDLIASDPDDYGRIATELFLDAQKNAEVSDHIRAKSDRLLGDHAGTTALNQLLRDL